MICPNLIKMEICLFLLKARLAIQGGLYTPTYDLYIAVDSYTRYTNIHAYLKVKVGLSNPPSAMDLLDGLEQITLLCFSFSLIK